MGGFGSVRHGGRPLADSSLRIDLAWMLRTGRARDGAHTWGSLRWTCGGQDVGSIGYAAKLHEAGQERLELVFGRTRRGERTEIRQTVWLTGTRPHYGGKRWWMLCPVNGHRVSGAREIGRALVRARGTIEPGARMAESGTANRGFFVSIIVGDRV